MTLATVIERGKKKIIQRVVDDDGVFCARAPSLHAVGGAGPVVHATHTSQPKEVEGILIPVITCRCNGRRGFVTQRITWLLK